MGSGRAWIHLRKNRRSTTCTRAARLPGKYGNRGKRTRWNSLMLSLCLRKQTDAPIRILCLGAHCDDIEIGCGGTILTLLETYRKAAVDWVVFSSDQQRASEARESANLFLKQAESKNVVIKTFTNSFFPYIGAEIKRYFEELKREIAPDLVFTHYRNDLHQDHRLISELAWNSFRDHMILEYEIPKYDGDMGSPNSFVHLA